MTDDTPDTTDVAVPEPSQVVEHRGHLSEQMRYAQALASAGLLPPAYRRQPANVLLAMEYAKALNIPVMTAIQGVHVIDGKPSASAGLISALVRKAGHRLRVTGDETHAVCEIVRADDPDFTFRCEWTLDRARAAKLTGKGTWQQYPAAMLKARAITECARDACPEALSGVAYTPEELGEETFAPETDAADAHGVQGEPGTGDPLTRHETGAAASPDIEDAIVVDEATGEVVGGGEAPASSPVHPETSSRRAAMWASLGDAFGRDDNAKREFIRDTVGHDFESTKDLTPAEESKVATAAKRLGRAS